MATRAEHAAKMWPILTRHAKNRQTLNFGTLYDLLGKGAPPPHALGSYLELIARYCKANSLPPLERLVISTSTGKVSEAEDAVFNYDWESVTPPTAKKLDGAFKRG